MRAVGVEVDFDPRLDEVWAQGTFRDLKLEPKEGHAFLVADRALLLDAQDLVEINARDRNEGRARLGRRRGEARIVGGQIDVAKEGVGSLDRIDPGERELLHEPVLQGLKRPLRPPARLGRIGPDMLDAELLERPPDLRRPLAVDLAAASGVWK